MMWHDWVDQAGVIGGFATGVGAGLALVALVPGIAQLRASAKLSREASALQAHREYLRLCFDHPDCSSTELFLAENPNIPLAAIGDFMTPASERYLWFLSIVVNTCEQITLFASSKGQWRQVAVSQLSYHAPALRVIWPKWKKHYDECVDELVKEALS